MMHQSLGERCVTATLNSALQHHLLMSTYFLEHSIPSGVDDAYIIRNNYRLVLANVLANINRPSQQDDAFIKNYL